MYDLDEAGEGGREVFHNLILKTRPGTASTYKTWEEQCSREKVNCVETD
jgi:hypothetical protein